MPVERVRILVPMDGSAEAETALPALVPFLWARAASITLLGVAETHARLLPLKAALDQVRDRLRSADVRAVTEAVTGDAVDEILQRAGSEDFDLVALATRGRSGLARAFLGSVTEEVLRRATIPLLVTRPNLRVRDWKRMLVALDGSTRAEAILPDVARLGRALRATLHVMRVVPPPVANSGLHRIPSYYTEEDPLPYLTLACERLAQKGLLALPLLREGAPAAEIVRSASEIEAGLICLTTHGRSGLSRAFLGSVAEQVMRNASCPVLVRRMASVEVPAEAGAR